MADIAEVFAAHRDGLWGLCYRMTGSAAEAEDLVQDTFARALCRPPRDTTRPWRPWLARVATRLAIDGRMLMRPEVAIRVTLHRARSAMAHYEAHRVVRSAAHDMRTEALVQRCMLALAARDPDAMAACLREDVLCFNDGAGVYHAALKPLRGRDHVVRFHLGVNKRGAPPVAVQPRHINGAPAWLVQLSPQRERDAPAALLRVDVGADGRVWQMHLLLAPDKLAALLR